MKPSTSKLVPVVDCKKVNMCIAEGCGESAVTHPEWDNEYCSIICCYNHCKTTFQAWLIANKGTSIVKTNTTVSPTQVDGSNNQKSLNE